MSGKQSSVNTKGGMAFVSTAIKATKLKTPGKLVVKLTDRNLCKIWLAK